MFKAPVSHMNQANAIVPPDLPVLRVLPVPDECACCKEDAGRILLGAFEPVAKPRALDGIPEDFCFDQLPDDFDHAAPILERATLRLPLPLPGKIGVHTFFNGPESFTHADRYLLVDPHGAHRISRLRISNSSSPERMRSSIRAVIS